MSAQQAQVEVARVQIATTDSQVQLAETQIEQQRSAQRMAQMRLDDTRIVAPFSGYISQRNLEVGAAVSNQAAATSNASIGILMLQEINPVKVQLEVPEREVARVGGRQRRAAHERRVRGAAVLRQGGARRPRAGPSHPDDGPGGRHPQPGGPAEARHVRAGRSAARGSQGRPDAAARGAHGRRGPAVGADRAGGQGRGGAGGARSRRTGPSSRSPRAWGPTPRSSCRARTSCARA